MNLHEAIEQRHSVRSYTDAPIGAEERKALEEEIERCNAEGGLAIKLVCDEPEAFNSALAHYGKFSGVRNYVVVAGPAASDLEERGGYFGERIVLLAQQLGLNTCWVALTFKKRFVKRSVKAGCKLVVVIAIGYGTTSGTAHSRRKSAAQVSSCLEPAPAWFDRGIEAALLAPTAVHQQSFLITLEDTGSNGALPTVSAKSKGGAYSKVDLGIVKLHFEIGAGKENFTWS